MFLRRSERAGGFDSECISGRMLFSTSAVAVGHWCGAVPNQEATGTEVVATEADTGTVLRPFRVRETGRCNPTIVTIYELAKALGVSRLDLLRPPPPRQKLGSYPTHVR